MSRGPSKHNSVATSITDTHRLSPYTAYHEIRKSWVMCPGIRIERCRLPALSRDHCASSGDFEAGGRWVSR